MNKIKIILADDHKIMRSGLKSILEKLSEMEIVAEAESGQAAIEMAAQYKPQIIIMDISMPGINGIEATQVIKKINPELKILALSMYMEREYVKGMFDAGASGFLIKDCAEAELTEAIQIIMDGGYYISRELTGIVLGPPQSVEKEDHQINLLTSREREVLILIANGLGTREIADKLFISNKTVETHRHNLMEKLHMHNVAELTKFAIKNGLSTL